MRILLVMAILVASIIAFSNAARLTLAVFGIHAELWSITKIGLFVLLGLFFMAGAQVEYQRGRKDDDGPGKEDE